MLKFWPCSVTPGCSRPVPCTSRGGSHAICIVQTTVTNVIIKFLTLCILIAERSIVNIPAVNMNMYVYIVNEYVHVCCLVDNRKA